MVREWCNREQYDGKIAYVFESGHNSQAQVNRILGEATAKIRSEWRYSSHTFAEKTDFVHLQAADLFAYECFKDVQRRFGLTESRII